MSPWLVVVRRGVRGVRAFGPSWSVLVSVVSQTQTHTQTQSQTLIIGYKDGEQDVANQQNGDPNVDTDKGGKEHKSTKEKKDKKKVKEDKTNKCKKDKAII